MRDGQHQEGRDGTSGCIQRASGRQQGGSRGTDVIYQPGCSRRGPGAGPSKGTGDIRLAFVARQAHLGLGRTDPAQPLHDWQAQFLAKAAGHSFRLVEATLTRPFRMERHECEGFELDAGVADGGHKMPRQLLAERRAGPVLIGMNRPLEGALQASRCNQRNPRQFATGRRLQRAGALFAPDTSTSSATAAGRRKKKV